MDLAQLRTAVYARLGVDDTDGMMDPTTINGFINDALNEIANERDWPWLQTSETITTTQGVDTYAPGSFNTTVPLPAWTATDGLRRGDDGRTMERMSPTELDDRWDLDQQARPAEWAVYGEKLILRPTPDGVYSILHRYYRAEVELAGDTDTPLLPVEFHPAVAELATFIALRRDRNDPRAQGAETAYAQWVAKMEKRKRRYKTPGRIRVRPGGFV